MSSKILVKKIKQNPSKKNLDNIYAILVLRPRIVFSWVEIHYTLGWKARKAMELHGKKEQKEA